jgi:hypothetical protein
VFDAKKRERERLALFVSEEAGISSDGDLGSLRRGLLVGLGAVRRVQPGRDGTAWTSLNRIGGVRVPWNRCIAYVIAAPKPDAILRV